MEQSCKAFHDKLASEFHHDALDQKFVKDDLERWSVLHAIRDRRARLMSDNHRLRDDLQRLMKQLGGKLVMPPNYDETEDLCVCVILKVMVWLV